MSMATKSVGFLSKPSVAVNQDLWQDAVVDAGGDGDYTTLAAAESGLTAPFTVWVKSGTYAGAVLAKVGLWHFEPGTIIDDGGTGQVLTVSGNKAGVILMPGCDIQVAYTGSGTDHYLEMRNGVASDGLTFNGARAFANGGGIGSKSSGAGTVEGIDSGQHDQLFLNMAAESTGSAAGVLMAGVRAAVSGVQVIASGTQGIVPSTNSTDDSLILGSSVLAATNQGMKIGGPRTRIVGNYVKPTQDGILLSWALASTNSSNSVVVGNIADQNPGIHIDQANANSVVVVGNRADTAITDSGTSSTIDANDVDPF